MKRPSNFLNAMLSILALGALLTGLVYVFVGLGSPVQETSTTPSTTKRSLSALGAQQHTVVSPEIPEPPPLPPTPTGVTEQRGVGSLPTPAVPIPTSTPVTPVPTQSSQPLATPRPLPLIPTRVGQPPAPTWNVYTDPNFGFSFRYPANWTVDVPTTHVSELPSHGYGVGIWNYNNVPVKRRFNPGEVKVDITILPELNAYGSLDEWVTERQLFAPGTEYSDMRSVEINGLEGLRWVARGPTVPEGAMVVALGKDNRIYRFDVVPANTQHISAVEKIIQSFRIP